MGRTINRFGGRRAPLESAPAAPQFVTACRSPLSIYARRCHQCNTARAIAGGRVRIVRRSGMLVNHFTCAGCRRI